MFVASAIVLLAVAAARLPGQQNPTKAQEEPFLEEWVTR
jgi:hypothetical protein